MRREASTSSTRITDHRLRRRLAWSTVIIRCAVLTLALLNPLLCIVHCALSHQHAAVHADDPQRFLCNLARDTQPAATPPFDRVWDGPRAVYELTPLGALALALVVVIVTTIAAPRLHAPQHITQPSAPPPKIVLCSTLA